MCLGVFLLGSSFFGTLWASWTSWKSISFARLGKFSFIICSNKFSIFCSSSSPSGTPIIRMLECFQDVLEVPKSLLIFLNSCFFILFWLDVSFFLLGHTIDFQVLCPFFNWIVCLCGIESYVFFKTHSIPFLNNSHYKKGTRGKIVVFPLQDTENKYLFIHPTTIYWAPITCRHHTRYKGNICFKALCI